MHAVALLDDWVPEVSTAVPIESAASSPNV